MKRVQLIVAVFLLFSLTAAGSNADERGTVIENFESGSVSLISYPDQDNDPGDWSVQSSNVYEGNYALRIHGNSWKIEMVTPVTLTEGTVWQSAVFLESIGEMQGIGVGDGTNELFYTFGGEDLPTEPEWWTVNQGAFPVDQWYAYLLPIGADWFATHGYLPAIDRVFYVNDDDSGSPAPTVYDAIVDVTDDLPVAPTVNILYTINSFRKVGRDVFEVGVQFYGNAFDPDSDSLTYAWNFGDGATSTDQNPLHDFLVESDYTYTVGLVVRDEEGLTGNDTCQVQVEPGETDTPLTVNFVGDIFTGRQYEYSGGIIDTYGIEALFEPTLPIYGEAADVSVCNLECSYTDRGTPHPTKSVVFRSSPDNIHGIAYAGIDLVDLANNHITDYGEVGMQQTIDSLNTMNIPFSGAGANSYFALQPTFWSEKGIRVAFLGQCNRCGRKWNYQPFLDAGYNKPGFGFLLPHNLESAIGGTTDLADIVVIQLHSGDEYETAPPDSKGNSGHIVKPPVEAAVISPDDPDFSFRVEPTTGERALRRMAADFGADVVINHHPHVLQGFESYNGKLIAHSLGNFIFDLYYPETMPTMVLTLEMEKEGITGYSFQPAWIDDYIPQPAVGKLGREIMDRIADYSRPMNAIVAVRPDEDKALIFLSRTEAESTVTTGKVSDTLTTENEYQVSPPLKVAGNGNLSGIESVTGNGTGWEIRWGREILWHGGFEEEGATFWDDNTSDEWLDDTLSYTGKRSLALRRHDYDTGQTGTDLEKHLPCDPDKEHSFTGFLKTDNAAEARMMARFYNSRTSGTQLSSTDMATRFTGSCDWVRQWKNLETPSTGTYFEVRCGTEPPATGTGYSWFDDIDFIEWEPWTTVSTPLPVPSPNNFRYVQIRSEDSGADSVSVHYRETVYATTSTPVYEGESVPALPTRLRNFPNPFNPRTTIEFMVPGSGNVNVVLDIYDIRGRKISALFSGILPGGVRSGISWDGKNNSGHPVPSGIYFCRAKIGKDTDVRKMLLLR